MMAPNKVRRTVEDRRQEFGEILAWAEQLPRPKVDYSQADDPAFLRLHFYHRLLIHQSAYMVLLRGLAALSQAGMVPEPIVRRGGLSLADVIEWSNGLTVQRLFEAYCAYPDCDLTAFVADLRLEAPLLDAEYERRIKDRVVAQEFIRLDWLEEERTKPITRLLRVDRIRGKTVNPREDGAEIQQTAWERALDLWRAPVVTPPTAEPLPEFPFRPDDMLPDERALWDGPMTRAWGRSQAALLHQAVAVLAGAYESIPGTVRDALREQWRTRDRRQRLDKGSEDFPSDGEDAGRAAWDWSDAARKVRQRAMADEAQIQPPPNTFDALISQEDAAQELRRPTEAYRLAQERWGARGLSFLEALERGDDTTTAAAHAGISRKTGDKYLKELKLTLAKKDPA